MSPQVPGRIGRYQVVGLIGTGAFATVFRARDDRLDADVAVKVLAENHSFDPDLRERFIMEGHLLRRVDSPHVVKVFDLGETDSGQPFLVLDLALGGDLSARRRALDPGRVEITDVMAAATQIAAALSALHAERVVHRDVTPGNLLIRSPGHAPPAGRLLGPGERLMLADLGLSKDLALASGLTVGAGTAGFAPPEQRDAAWIDPRADIWSASALVVWLATGQRPEDGDDWPTQLRRQGWPQAAAGELARGLSDDVDARHPDAQSWRAALHDALAPPSPAPVGRPDPGPPAPPPRRARRGLVGAAALVVLVVVLGGGWWAGRATQDDRREQTTESVEGGEVRVSAADGALRVAAVGPESVAVGSPARFVADVEGASQFVWIAPDGRTYTDAPTIELRPQSAGEARVLLTGVAADGKVVTVEQRLVVTEP
ncbi:serine/threonine-protein kinase [Iamia sp.]|uniref:serine/threonine-protein kinase n=1 Tax=Iamia sp. TaxID=2722710 RepID=UPI002CC7E654|nr:serine/threonine-protein kinase [Iamia sp.]HXH59495.1 serine/threonine-protein kinase [Iamia sp.]